MKRLLLGTALGLFLGVTGQAKADYMFRRLDPPDSSRTEALGINSYGHIVGNYEDGNHIRHGFLLIGDCYTPFDVPDSTLTGASGINDSDEIVGRYIDADGIQHGYKRLTDGSSYERLPDPPDGTSLQPYAINNSGRIVGWYVDADGIQHGFLLSEGQYTRTDPPFSTQTFAEGINNFGIIVGAYRVADRARGYVRLSGGRFIYPPDPEPESMLTNAIGINDLGQISGSFIDSRSIRHGFVLEYGQYTPLDPPEGINIYASGINASGWIVGQYTEAATPRVHGYLATPVPEPGPGAPPNRLGAQ